MVLDSKPKKRTSETREDSKDSKKQKKEDSKEFKKKKGESKDSKAKFKEDSKESKKLRKEKHGDLQFDSESSALDDSFFPAGDNENSDLCSESKEEKQKVKSGKEKSEQEMVQKDSFADRQPDGSASTEEDSIELKVKRKKKKLKKHEDYKEESRKVEMKDTPLEKKSIHKKQKVQEKVKASTEVDKVSPTPAPVQRASKLSTDERGRRSTDSTGEVSSVNKLKNSLNQTEKNTNWRDNEEDKMRDRLTALSVGVTLEKFSPDSEHNKGRSMVGEKFASKCDLNTEDI